MRLQTSFGPVEAIEQGRGDGLAVLLHAAGSSPRALVAMARALEQVGCRSIAPQLPMRPVAQRTGTAPRHPLAMQVEAARAALAHDGCPRIVAGHSFGGLVGLLSVLDGAKPDALVLYEPIVLAALASADPADQTARAWDRALIDRLDDGIAAGDPEAGIGGFIEAYNETAWTALPAKVRAAIVADAPAIRALTQVVHHLPIDRDALARVTVPTLILCGTRSPDITRRMAKRLAATLPRATLSVIEGAGHMAPVLAPDRLMPAIAGVLAALNRGP